MTLRKQLDQIDAWLCEPGGVCLWDVLTALRSDDADRDAEYKYKTVCVIRARAFPRFAKREASGGLVAAVNTAQACPVLPAAQGSLHFRDHLCDAAQALGLALVVEPRA